MNILACPGCQVQYRVDKYPPGQKVRCLCGQSMTVPKPAAHEAKILHCADCGGPLSSAGATSCDYCGGVLDPDQKHYTLVCPDCFARLPENARFCIECALPIRPQHLEEHKDSTRDCPRCQTRLLFRTLEGVVFDECPKCLGMWVKEEAFKAIGQRKVAEFRDNPLPSGAGAPVVPQAVEYLKCPDCSTLMNRQNYGRRSGVIVDRCKGHGIWLDDQELERIARFIAEGGLARARAAEAEQAKADARRASMPRAGGPISMPSDVYRDRDTGLTVGFLDVLANIISGH